MQLLELVIFEFVPNHFMLKDVETIHNVEKWQLQVMRQWLGLSTLRGCVQGSLGGVLLQQQGLGEVVDLVDRVRAKEGHRNSQECL